MSKLSLTPNGAGTGTYALASPNNNASHTLTLPVATGELLTSTGDGSGLTSLTSGNLTGALPAIDGSALTGVPSVGVGQSWQDVRASRVLTTSYQNTTSLPIQVMVISSKNNTFELSSDNTTWVAFGTVGATGAYDESRSVIIPVDHYYRVGTGVGAVEIWAELR